MFIIDNVNIPIVIKKTDFVKNLNFVPIYRGISTIKSLMTKEEFKNYVLSEAKRIIASENNSASKKKAANKETDGDYITSDSITKLVNEMKAINKSLAISNPLIAENNIVDKVVGEEETRKLTTPVGRKYDIELKDTLNETMIHYNDQKKVIIKESDSKSRWNKLINYKPISEEE